MSDDAALDSLAFLTARGGGQAQHAHAGLPPPPYQLRDAQFMLIVGRLNGAAVRRLLPSGMEPADGNFGGIFSYTVNEGPIAPYSGLVSYIEVKNHTTPDGTNGRFVVRSYYSGVAGRVFSERSTAIGIGQARHVENGCEIVGYGGPPGREVVKLGVRLTGRKLPPFFGANYYLGEHPKGGIAKWPVSFAIAFEEATPLPIEVTPDADPRLLPFAALEPAVAVFFRDCALTIGDVAMVGDPEQDIAASEARASLLNICSQLGRGAAIVNADGGIVLLNDKARVYLGDGLVEAGGGLRAWRGAEQAELVRIVAVATRAGAARLAAEQVALSRPSGAKPLLVQALPASSAARPALAVLLITDPELPPAGDAHHALQLLGLTAAEARIAALIGKGRSARETASALGISEGTIRTTLNQVYSKLGLGKASELAALVSRISLHP